MHDAAARDVARGCRIVCSWFVRLLGAAPIASPTADRHVPARRRLLRRGSPRCAGPWFECPRCGHDHGWALRGKAHTFECARCHRQTSVTAGTILHGSKLALTVWFWAAYLMATHSNGIAALQLQNQLGIGSYRSAWLLAAKLRKAMVDPERDPLSGLISTRPRWRSAPRMIPWPAAPGAATTASCSSSAPSRSATATRRAAFRVLRRRKPQPLHRPQHRRRQHDRRRLPRRRAIASVRWPEALRMPVRLRLFMIHVGPAWASTCTELYSGKWVHSYAALKMESGEAGTRC